MKNNEKKPRNYWTIEKCKEEGLKYTNKTTFIKECGSVYNASKKNGWINEVCSHMIPLGSLYKRYIYAYEFPDNHVYVGLTFNIEKRNWQHKNQIKSSVYKHIKKTGLEPKLIQITKYVLDVEESIKLETSTVERYKKEGWIILNKAKPGALGINKIKWTFERCKEEALKYKTRSEFKNNSKTAHSISSKNKWLDEICSHMKSVYKPYKYWSVYENCEKEFLKYRTKSEFKEKSHGAFVSAFKNGWLEQIIKKSKDLKDKN